MSFVAPSISVVIPTRNPHRARLAATLAGLAVQSLSPDQWELIVVDNGSTPRIDAATLSTGEKLRPSIISEPTSGLTHARIAGIRAARGDIIVFVDDDNVLAADHLAGVKARFAALPQLGAAGGPVIPQWEVTPPPWTQEFHGLLALRDLGAETRIASAAPDAPWPNFAPVGAGLAVRRDAALRYTDEVARDPQRRSLDRTGMSLASGGDNDLVFTVLHGGGDVGYFPELRVTHLIPASRLDAGYLARLNRGIMRTWVRVLTLHGHCPWRPVAPATVPLRVVRAWFRVRAWSGPAARVRWAGARGQFEGLADVSAWPLRQPRKA